MFSVLEKIGVPPVLINWVNLLYSDPNCSVIINNFIGSLIEVTRGVRQGCPLSPLLYSICAEGLASLVRSNSSICGISIQDRALRFRIIQHADDTNLFVSNDSEFEVIEDIITEFCMGTGSRQLSQIERSLAWQMA